MVTDSKLEGLAANAQAFARATRASSVEERRSFAYGNARIENERISLDMIAEAQFKMGDEHSGFFYLDRQERTYMDEAKLLNDPNELARRQAENNVALATLVDEVIRSWLAHGHFTLHKGIFWHLNFIAGIGLGYPTENVGAFRNDLVQTSVANDIERLCDYVNDNWHESDAIHLAAFTIWKTLSIHPFQVGNGYTARAVGYVVLGMRLNSFLPGKPTIPEQMAIGIESYREAIMAAEQAWDSGHVDVSMLETLLEGMVQRQLLNATMHRGECFSRAPTR